MTKQSPPRQGTLDFVDNALNRSSGTIHARATFPNPDGFLTPGVFARVRAVVGAPVQALLVPDTAVLPDQSQHIIMIVAPDGTVVPKRKVSPPPKPRCTPPVRAFARS